jgi:glutamine synthetase
MRVDDSDGVRRGVRAEPTTLTRKPDVFPAEGACSDAVEDWIRREGIDKVQLLVVDLHGVPRAKVVTADWFIDVVMGSGHPWQLPLLGADLRQQTPEGSGYGEEVSFRNGTMIPDLQTLRAVPWSTGTAEVLCDVHADGEPCPTPRQVCARVLARASRAGYEVMFGSELEFYVYREGDRGFEPVLEPTAWFSQQALAELGPLVDDILRSLTAARVPVYELFNEHGSGQLELNLRPARGLTAIDDVIVAKSTIKQIARRHGYHATFMTQPSNHPGVTTSGYHLHQCLWDDQGANVFYSNTQTALLSETGRRYVGGQLNHANALTALAAPTTNAYKRFRSGTWAPRRATWGYDNRTTMVRALGRDDSTRVENRIGSGCANPYLLAAGCVAAGLDGVERQLDPGDPAEGDVFDDASFPAVPTALSDALHELGGDEALVDALGSDFARLYRRTLEGVCQRSAAHVTDWEIQEYRSVL